MWALLFIAQASQPASNPLLTLDVGEPLVGQTLEEAMAEGVALRKGGLGPRGILSDVKNQLGERIVPERSHSEFVAFARQLLNDVEAWPKPKKANDILNDATPQQRGDVNVAPGQGGGAPFKGGACFGNCEQKHEVFRIVALLRIEHDAAGVPKAWRLKVPSVSATFNRQVLEQAAQLVTLRPPPGEPVPEWSEWTVTAIQYRWGIIERILDPAFKPKSLVTEVVLRAVKYR